MNEELQKAREQMNASQKDIFDVVAQAHPGSVSVSILNNIHYSYNARKTEINHILEDIGWRISKVGKVPGAKKTYLYGLVRIAPKSDGMGQYELPCVMGRI